MKPKTKLDFRVTKLSALLPPLTLAQIQWAKKECFDCYAAKLNKNIYCLDCGAQWKVKEIDLVNNATHTCPDCHKKLEMLEHNGNCRKSAYFNVITYKEEFQIQRIFIIHKDLKKKTASSFWACEVMQHWVGTNGKKKTLSHTTHGGYMYADSWNYASGLEVRSHYNGYNSIDNISVPNTYPRLKIHPILKRNGFNGNMMNFHPYTVFSTLFTTPLLETLLKAKQVNLAAYLISRLQRNSKEDYISPIMTCLKNNYFVADEHIWADLIDIQRYFNRDLHCSKYVCPENLKKEHDRLVEKRRNVQRKRDIEKVKAEMKENQAEYILAKKKFFNLLFKEDDLVITPLKSIEDFWEEGSTLRHCVFENEYFNKKHSLILSASVGDIKQETIELDLNNFTIKQSRGLGNSATTYHERILKLMKENISKIQEINTPKKRKRKQVLSI